MLYDKHITFHMFNIKKFTKNMNIEKEYILECDYRYNRFENEVYLIGETASKNIHIDNGAAYVDVVSDDIISLHVSNLSFEEGDELDERYAFTHTLSFTVNGYVTHEAFQGKYFVVLRDKNNAYWLLNPIFPCKVTYTYTLNASASITDFTLSTVSNHPMLRAVVNQSFNVAPYSCGYSLVSFEKLMLNETDFSSRDSENHIIYTNDGFKEITFSKGTQQFQETWDGNSIFHSISFDLPLESSKGSWHYNMLEFPNNTYSAIIRDSDNKFITVGFDFGLQPNYTIFGSGGNDEYNRIEMTFQSPSNDLAVITDDGTITMDGGHYYAWSDEHDGYECVGNGTAIYLLQAECDALGNPTGSYKCLDGYESRFENLNIVGTFDEKKEYENPKCTEICDFSTTLPSTIYFKSASSSTYTLTANNDWSISSNDSRITVSPSSGHSGIHTLTVQSTTSEDLEASILLTVCNSSEMYGVVVGNGYCLAKTAYTISSDAQTLTIPCACCVKDLSANAEGFIIGMHIFDDKFTINVTENKSKTFGRSTNITVTYCDDTTRVINIVQEKKKTTNILAYLRLNNDSSVKIYGDNVLTSAMTSGYSATCVNAIITSLVTSIGNNAFSGWTQLSSVTIGNNVTTIGNGAFDGCSGLTDIVIPNSVTSIGNSAFRDCTSVVNILIGSSVTSIGNRAFESTGLRRITLRPQNPPSLGRGAFFVTDCPIYVPNSSLRLYLNAWLDYSSRIVGY